MTPQAGDYGVLLLAKRNWLKRLVVSTISWGTHSKAYHAVLVVDAPGRGLAIVEAKPTGAKLSAWDKYPNVVWGHPALTPTQRHDVNEAGLKFVGREYGFYDDLAIGVSDVFKFKIPKVIWGWLSNGGAVECAQLVDAAELAGGYHMFSDGRQTGEVSPADLYTLILEG